MQCNAVGSHSTVIRRNDYRFADDTALALIKSLAPCWTYNHAAPTTPPCTALDVDLVTYTCLFQDWTSFVRR